MENKAVVLQPRRGLTSAFQLVWDRLSADPDYTIHLHELSKNTVPRCCYFFIAKQFIEDAATAKGIFIHESNAVLSHIPFRKGQKVIQLWHGCGVLKQIGLDTYGKDNFMSWKRYHDYPQYRYFSLVTIAGPALVPLFSQFMGIEESSGILQPIGVSRTDVFFDPEYRKQCRENFLKRIPAARNKKAILYAPTYRGVDPIRTTPDELDIAAFEKALGKDYILIFKHHQTVKELPVIPKEYRDTFAFDLTHDSLLDINALMTVCDICISDYSSVIYEFSLFERPILSFVFDYEEYDEFRGIYTEYFNDTPGPKCRTSQEMIDYILHLDERFDRQEVINFRKKYMSGCDGHSTDRILAYLKDENPSAVSN